VLLRLAYLGVTNAFALLRLLPMGDREKDVEILALRHQLTVLERQLGSERVRFDPADRAFLAAVLQRVPGAVLRRVRLLVRPDTVLRWPSRGGALAVRLHAQHRQVHDLLDGDGSLKRISRQLGLARGTVRRLARAGTVEELLAGRRLPAGPRLLDPYEEHLRRRWADGVTNAAPCSPRSAPWVTAAATAPCSSTSGPGALGNRPPPRRPGR
jgi:hypothetical protein